MAEYLIQDFTLTEIANAIRGKTGITGSIPVSNMASEIANINIGGEYELPVLNENYPEDVTINVIRGGTTSASFIAAIYKPGNPAEYTYQWYVDGIAVEGATSSTYTKDGLTTTEKHSVYCEITNKKGIVTTRIATLEVIEIYPPILYTTYPQNAAVELNTSVTCQVQIDTAGNPAEYTYQWYVNGSRVSGATSQTYNYTPTSLGKVTLYCEVTNSAGTVTSRTATITPRQYLYKPGNQCTSLTGGWTSSGYRYDDNSPAGGGTVETNYLQAKYNNTNNIHYEGWIGTKSAINLTGKSKLCADSLTTAAQSTSKLYITTKKNYLLDGVAAQKYLSTSRATITIDISKITGNHYIGFGASHAGQATSRVYSMWFE